MQRFLAVGQSRLHVVQAVPHDVHSAARALDAVTALAPQRVHMDLDEEGWQDALAGRPNGFDQRLLRILAPYSDVEPHRLHRDLASFAATQGARLALNPGRDVPPPKGRHGLRGLDRLLRREGFEAWDAVSAVRRLHEHYVARLPALHGWLEAKRRLLASRLVLQYQEAAETAVVVLAFPDGEAVADHVTELRSKAQP